MITLAQHHQVSPCILQVRQAREFNDFRMLPSETHLRASIIVNFANRISFCCVINFILEKWWIPDPANFDADASERRMWNCWLI